MPVATAGCLNSAPINTVVAAPITIPNTIVSLNDVPAVVPHDNVSAPTIDGSQSILPTVVHGVPVLSYGSLDVSQSDGSSAGTSLPASSSSEPLISTPLIRNSHHMITRGKSGIFKPKVFIVDYKEVEPPNVQEALRHDH